jgi:hypothetical protein
MMPTAAFADSSVCLSALIRVADIYAVDESHCEMLEICCSLCDLVGNRSDIVTTHYLGLHGPALVLGGSFKAHAAAFAARPAQQLEGFCGTIPQGSSSTWVTSGLSATRGIVPGIRQDEVLTALLLNQRQLV